MSKYIDADALKNQRPENLNNRRGDYNQLAYASGWNDSNECWCDMIDDMSAADVEPVRKWISVGERLPEIEQDVLVAFDDGFIATACIEKDGDWGLWQESGEVTHWQPLPELPKINGGNEKNGEN